MSSSHVTRNEETEAAVPDVMYGSICIKDLEEITSCSEKGSGVWLISGILPTGQLCLCVRAMGQTSWTSGPLGAGKKGRRSVYRTRPSLAKALSDPSVDKLSVRGERLRPGLNLRDRLARDEEHPASWRSRCSEIMTVLRGCEGSTVHTTPHHTRCSNCLQHVRTWRRARACSMSKSHEAQQG